MRVSKEHKADAEARERAKQKRNLIDNLDARTQAKIVQDFGVRSVTDLTLEQLSKYVPKMATGGIVRRPTIAMIGEAGPEAVVPLNKGGMRPINIYIQGDVYGIDNLDRHIAETANILFAQGALNA